MQREDVLSGFLFGAVLALSALAGCSSTPHAVGTPPAAQSAMFDRLKSLAGEWTMPDESGKTITASVFSVTAGGSAVREVMFPGTSHEMTNVYHMDGPSLLVTHYCAAGNQPRMRCTNPNTDGSMTFSFDSVTNLATPESHYMGSLTLRTPDATRLEQDWISTVNGKQEKDHTVFTLTRKGA